MWGTGAKLAYPMTRLGYSTVWQTRNVNIGLLLRLGLSVRRQHRSTRSLPALLRIVVRVPGQANPYLAGMPDGARAGDGDSAPRQSPVLVNLSLTGAVAVSFSAVGGVNHGPSACPPMCDSPNGAEWTDHRDGSENGISNVTAPYEALRGIFLEDSRPDRLKPPKHLDFNRIGLSFNSLSPELRQVFFIGTGATKDGRTRRYLVPKGAARLYLAIMDAYQWNNNSGSFAVTVSAERADVSSQMFSADSAISYAKGMPAQPQPVRRLKRRLWKRRLHVGSITSVLPAQLEWGREHSNAIRLAAVTVRAVLGKVCSRFSLRAPPKAAAARSRGMANRPAKVT